MGPPSHAKILLAKERENFMRKNWKRWIAGLMTAVMLMGTLPTAAYAALWENSASHNREILAALEELCSSEDEARYYYDLLDEYGLLDEDGDLFTNWSGVITIQEESTPLTISEVRAMMEGNVTVNGRACSMAKLNAALDQMESLGLLADNAPVADWQLRVDGQNVAPAELDAALDSWTAPEVPEQTDPPAIPEEAPDTSEPPKEPETPEEVEEPETPELPQSGGAGTPEQSGGILASIGRFFGIGASAQAPAAPAVTVLGTPADPDELLEAIAFLEQYGLLTDTGCMTGWDLALPGGDREITADELLDMVEGGELADGAMVDVDGIPVTVADLKVMLEIEEYIAYLRKTYFDGHKWTQEQLDNLEDLTNQINNEGIEFQGPKGEAPDKFQPDVTLSVSAPETYAYDSGAYTAVVSINKPQSRDVFFTYTFYAGSLSVFETAAHEGDGLMVEGRGTIPAGSTRTTISVYPYEPEGKQAGAAFMSLRVSNVIRATLKDGGPEFFQTVSTYIDREKINTRHYPEKNDPDCNSNDFPPGSVPKYSTCEIWVPEGTYTPGQTIPIRINTGTLPVYLLEESRDFGISFYTEGNQGNKQTLVPMEKGYAGKNEKGAGFYLTYLYKVQEGDSGALCIDYDTDYADRNYLFLFYPANDTMEMVWEYFWIIPPGGGVSGVIGDGYHLHGLRWETACAEALAAATVERHSPKESVLLNFSMDILHDGERESLTDPSMEVSLTLTSDRYFLDDENMKWLQSAAIENPEGEGFVTDPKQLAFSFDGGKTLHSFPIPSQSDGDPIVDFTGVTLTAVLDLPVLNEVPKYWYNDPGYPATDDVPYAMELYVDGAPLYGFADTDTQRGIRFTTSASFKAGMELAHKDGSLWTEEDYQNIGFTDLGLSMSEYLPWFTPAFPTLSARDTELRLNVRLTDEYAQERPLSFGDTSRVTGFALDEDGYQWDPDYACQYVPLDVTADFGLMSVANGSHSRPSSVAQVDKTGKITYLTPGLVEFDLYAINGRTDVEDRFAGSSWSVSNDVYMDFIEKLPLPPFPAPTQAEWEDTWRYVVNQEEMPPRPTTWEEFGQLIGETFTSWADIAVPYFLHDTIYISMGSDPFLELPNPAMQATGGQEVTIYWSSNLCELNKGETAFTVTVSKGGEAVYTTTATGSRENPVSSVTIPGDTLKYDYGADSSNQYTVTVSTSYQEQAYTAQGTIDLAAKPATVKLDTLSGYYITDATSSVEIGWDLTDFGDTSQGQGENQQFELLITNGSEKVEMITAPGTAYGDDSSSYRGSYTLKVADVEIDGSDPTSFRDVYTVTVKAMAGKNGTWSYDSFLLYVYDQNALDILIGGESVEDYKLSNRDRISKMKPEDIVALNRDIQLKEVISTNYGERAWNALADQIIWKSGDSGVASINYPDGSFYDNIENYSYVSYRPTTDFGIQGRENGQTTFTATHKVTGISDSVPITVETLENKLYLFQFYPQVKTTIVYTNGNGETKTAYSDEKGAAAIYEESGIQENVYCSSKNASGKGYRGTIYPETLKSGEGDWTKLEQYPCNNLNLRRTAYAYLYLKQPNGEPYTGTVSFRGGIYVNDKYVEEGNSGLFFLNGSDTPVYGNQGVTVDLSKTGGKLTVEMDQTLWDSKIKNGDQVSYIFELIAMDGRSENQEYYPIFTVIDASANQSAFVSSGEAIVNFRENPVKDDAKHPFIATQIATLGGGVSNVMDYTGYVGINEDLQSGILSTAVMWWNDEGSQEHSLQLETFDGRKIAANEGEYTIETTTYPFTSHPVTNYTVRLDADTVGKLLDTGKAVGVTLKYYTDGQMVRSEEMPYRLGNLRGAGKAEDSAALLNEIKNMGNSFGADASKAKNFVVDEYVSLALEFVADEDYTAENDKAFRMQIAPTSDPTKFLGFISTSLGSLNDTDQVTGIYGEAATGKADLDAAPGFREIMALAGEKTPLEYGGEVLGEFLDAKNNRGINSTEWGVSGYMEALIYYDFGAYAWQAQILSGGFNAGGGMSRSWRVNTWAGIIPFTATLSVGGSAQVSMDALAVSYYNQTKDLYGMGNDFLTELRLYLYLKFFAGIGFDYSVVAAKVGVFGQVDLDMAFQWLNRPYMDSEDTVMNVADQSTNQSDYNLDGQNFKIRGTVGLEALFKLLFISYEKILCSKTFNILNEKTGQWETIQTNWDLNSEANRNAITGMAKNGSLSVYSVGGQQIATLNLAPTLEDRSYLENGGRSWGPGFSLFSLDTDNGLENLESNTYPYANPVITDDGQLVAYLHDNGSPNVEDTVVKYAAKSGSSYSQGGEIPAPSGSEAESYGDSQLSLGGTGSMAVAAWTRQMTSIQKDHIMTDPETGEPIYGIDENGKPIYGPVLTADEQMMMLNGSEIYASVYANGQWTTTRLTENSTADMAPVVASNGKTAVVAWRAVSASNLEGGTNSGTLFDQRDSILYKVYDGNNWSEVKTLYNGTSGAVKGIVADMMADGTAAVAYTLDTDLDDATTVDREIAYAVIESGEVTRSVQATKDSYLDENPQLTSVKFGEEERFVLGWYTEQAVASDDAAALDGGEGGASDETVSDIRLMEFGADGSTSQLLPDSMDQIASSYDVNITSNFRFTKNSNTINDLSILWVERAEEVTAKGDDLSMLVERDVLKGVKFYTYGEDHQQISFTAAVDVAEMGDGTLIDHFDAYVSDPEANEIKAVILGTTYDANNPVTRVAQTTGGETVSFRVPARESAMYTATESYADKIEVPAFLPDYDTVRLNANTQIQFTVENKGIHTISKIDIQVGDQTTSHELETPLLPSDSIQLYADYSVGGKVIDPTYKVTATFDQNTGASGSAETGGSDGVLFGLIGAKDGLNVVSGTIYLDLPDVEIVQAEVMSEEDGQRTIQIGLNNHSDAALADSGRSVRLSFFTDAACQTPVDVELLPSIVISEDNDLSELDEGGYSKQIAFDVGEFVKSEDGAVQEIPSGGVTIYIKAEVLDKDKNSQGKPVVQGEPTSTDNFASVTCDNLKERAGKDVIIKSDITVEDGTATVTVDLQNTRLTQTTTGNLLVTMLDANGNVVGYRQSYDPDANDKGLITLKGEGKAETRTFTFDDMEKYPNATFQVQYSDLVMEEESGEVNTELGSLYCEGLLADINSVKWKQTADGHYEAAVTSTGVRTSKVTATAKSPDAKVSISGKESEDNVAFETVSLNEGTGTITITVTNGAKSSTYVLNVVEAGTPGPDPDPEPEPVPVTGVSLNKTSMELEVGESERLTATVEPADATNKSVTWSTSNSSVARVDASGNVEAVSAGTATITVTTADSRKTAACAVTVTTAPINPDHGGSGSGGSGSPNYEVDTDTDNAHGTVTVKPSRAEKGDTVTITAKPDEGYQVGKVTVTAKNGDTVKVIDKGDGVYTFTMPNSKVSVDVTFVPEKQWTNPFLDVPEDAWYYDAVRYVNEHGLMAGTSANTFAPDLTTTRGMIVTILYRLEGSPNIENEIWGYPFKDVDANAYYATAVYWARMSGIVAGYSDELFGPNDTITREQMATILYRYAQYKGYDTTAKADLSKYTDAAQVGSWAVEAIRWANAEGLVNGTSATTLTPKGSATRAQVAVILTRFCQNIVK